MSRLQADLLLVIVAVIWGSAFVAQSLGMANVGPYTFTGARFLLGALVVAPLAYRELVGAGQREEAGPVISITDLRFIIGLGSLLFIGAAFQQIGIVSTSVTNAGFLTALYVPLVPLLAWLFLRHRPHWSTWPATAGCLTGTWLLTGGQSITIGTGDLWVIASAVFWAGHVLLVGHGATRNVGPFTLACGQFLVTGIVGSVVALILEPISLAPLAAAAGSIIYAGILSVGVGFTGQVIGQRHTPPADTAIILSTETAFAALFGAWFLGERITQTGVIGCGLILSGILMIQLMPLIETMKRLRR